MTARFVFLLSLLLLLSAPSEAGSLPERRRPQFQTEAGYYIIPAPYSLPGVGQGFALIGSRPAAKGSKRRSSSAIRGSPFKGRLTYVAGTPGFYPGSGSSGLISVLV